MSENEKFDKTARYNLSLPQELYYEVEKIAEDNGMTVAALLRRYIKLGILVTKVNDTPGSEFLIRENGIEKKVILL